MIRVVVLSCVLTLVLGSSGTRAEEARAPDENEGGTLRVEVLGVRSEAGRVGCALFRGSSGFPDKREQAEQGKLVRIRDGKALCVFRNVRAGEYAVAVLHDENDNGKLDTKIFGIPKEGYGVSRDAEPRTFGPPRYDDAKFRFDGTSARLQIRLRY